MTAAPETSTALVKIRRAANLPDSFADERIQAIRDFCIPPSLKVNVSQLAMFLAACNRYQLDPMLGELWLAESDGKVICVTGRNTWVKLASQQADFAGIQSAVVHEKDEFSAELTEDGRWLIHHKINGMNRGGIVGAYAQLFLRGKPPIFKQRLMSDYKHFESKKNWRTSPKDMIEIRALTACFRQAWPLSGLFDPTDEGAAPEDVQLIESGVAQERTLSEADRLRARLAELPTRPLPPAASTGLDLELDAELDAEIEEGDAKED